jgi:hypothetical protein
MVGVATIFGTKAERDQHWSIPPTAPVDPADDERADPGAPP